MRGHLLLLPLLLFAVLSGLLGACAETYVAAGPGAVTVREEAYGLPHIYADTDIELAREAGAPAFP